MKTKVIFLSIFWAMFALLMACYNDNLSEMTPSSGVTEATCDTAGVITYSTQVSVVLRTNCGTSNSCHGHSNTSGYDLSTYTGVKAVAANGKLISSITWTGSATRMPNNGPKMNSCNIIKIQKWVDDGALNN
ncbi:hypothetical protein [Ohtaekwangia sp.]|uniref:hypothetical protein n=1 Tax=Ohtaekwangia sp. TaxID=2066019 RepID=UPI002F95D73E